MADNIPPKAGVSIRIPASADKGLATEVPPAIMDFMERSLVYYPDPGLREVARSVGEITPEIRDIVPRMIEVMRERKGIGLAGPQVGFGFRVVIASVPQGPEEEPLIETYVDPGIIERSGVVAAEEGCLSLPGLMTQMERAERVVAEYTTLEGERRRVEIEGLHARMFQHEIDHLDGILIIDRMSPAEKRQWAPLLRELEEDFASNRVREHGTHEGAAL